MKRIHSTGVGKRLTYTFTVAFEDGSEKGFTIKDDGWKVWVDNESGYVDSLLFPEYRQPDKRDTERHLEAWAWKRYSDGYRTDTADCGHTVCVGCGGHIKYADSVSHEDEDQDVSICNCCHDCGKPGGHN